jgi:3-dehydroquinate synthase
VARERSGWSNADHQRVLRALRHSGLSVRLRRLSVDAIVESMRVDKKRFNGSLRFVLPVRLGEVRTGVEIPHAAVREALDTLQTRPVRGTW